MNDVDKIQAKQIIEDVVNSKSYVSTEYLCEIVFNSNRSGFETITNDMVLECVQELVDTRKVRLIKINNNGLNSVIVIAYNSVVRYN